MSFNESYAELAELTEARRLSYSFFSSVFYAEVNEEFIKELANFQADEGTTLAEFVASLKDADLAEVTQKTHSDYARLFLNMSANPVYTSESVYVSDEHLIMREQRDQVVDIYRLNGLEVDKAFGQPEDHIAIEMLFMAHLCEQMGELLKEAQVAGADTETLDVRIQTMLDAQKGFYDAHLIQWIPDFCDLIVKEAKTLFYKGVAEYLNEFMKAEGQYFAQ